MFALSGAVLSGLYCNTKRIWCGGMWFAGKIIGYTATEANKQRSQCGRLKRVTLCAPLFLVSVDVMQFGCSAQRAHVRICFLHHKLTMIQDNPANGSLIDGGQLACLKFLIALLLYCLPSVLEL